MPLTERVNMEKRGRMMSFALHMLRYTCQNTNTTDTQQEAKNSKLRLKIRLLEGNKHFKTLASGKYISQSSQPLYKIILLFYIYNEETEI